MTLWRCWNSKHILSLMYRYFEFGCFIIWASPKSFCLFACSAFRVVFSYFKSKALLSFDEWISYIRWQGKPCSKALIDKNHHSFSLSFLSPCSSTSNSLRSAVQLLFARQPPICEEIGGVLLATRMNNRLWWALNMISPRLRFAILSLVVECELSFSVSMITPQQNCYICSHGAYRFLFDQYTRLQALFSKYKLFIYINQYLRPGVPVSRRKYNSYDVIKLITNSRIDHLFHVFVPQLPSQLPRVYFSAYPESVPLQSNCR